MLNLAVPPQFANLVARLPVTPPSLAFSLIANRLLWPALQTLDWQPLANRRYALRVKDLGLSLRFTVTARGFAPDSGAPELTISATARDFLLLLARREDPDTLFFSRRLVSEGDTELGLVVKNLLDALDPDTVLKDALNKLIPLMVRQAHHERNQQVAVRPELVEGLVQRFPR